MNVFVSGINYKAAPLEVRERLSLNQEDHRCLLKEISALLQVKECVVLSTCNRTEVYVYTESCHFDNQGIEKLLCDFKGVPLYEFKKHFYFYSSLKAVRHLFKVASGLDSMVIGEDQILGQVKSAHELSHETGISAEVLNTLFRDAITAAKSVKTFTELSKNSVSTASLAAKLATDYFGNLGGKTALVIGAGKIGSIALNHLLSHGIEKMYVTVRAHGKAADATKAYPNVHAVDYSQRYSVMNDCDIIISSTTGPHYTITKDMLDKTLLEKKDRVFIDLAVPRDIDVSIGGMQGVHYFNMDHLQLRIDKNIDKRLLEVSKAEEILQKYIVEFERWYNFRSVLPVVKDIQKYAGDLLQERIHATMAKLQNVSEGDRETVRASMTVTVNEILNKFIYSVKECGSKEDIETYFRCLGEVIRD